MDVGIHAVDVELGMDVLEDILVVIICHGITEGPIVGMTVADSVHDVHLLKDVMNVAICIHRHVSQCGASSGTSALEIHEVCHQHGPQRGQNGWIVVRILTPVHTIEYGGCSQHAHVPHGLLIHKCLDVHL